MNGIAGSTRRFRTIAQASIFATILHSLCSFSSQADNLKVGALLGLTGPSSVIGHEIQQGMQLCADPDSMVIFEDSQGQPAVGLSAFKKLVELDRVDVSVVTFSGVAGAVVPVAAKKRVPVMLTLVSARGVIKDNSQDLFRFFTSGEQEGPIMAKYLATSKRMSRAAILYLEDEYGQSYSAAFADEFKRNGGMLVAEEGYSRETQDFRGLLLRIKNKQSEVVYVIGHDSHILNVLRQAKEAKMSELFASNWILASPTIRRGNEALLDGVVFTSPDFYWAESPKQILFRKMFQAKYAIEPTAYSALGCDVIDLIERQPVKSFGASLRSLKGYEGVIGQVSSAADGSLEFPLYPVQLRYGKMMLLSQP
jgi:branched-chain amino acid transport system substrate-binding protein